MNWSRLLLGRRLASREQAEQKIGVLAGIAALGLDGLASSAYGPEAALVILAPLGAAGLHYIGPITAIILVVLAILCISYRQTIAAYPGGGGSYTVAKENLGSNVGLIAAAALLLDYVLNVAVAISAGVAALTSAVPTVHRFTLPLCLIVLALITIVNLRGTVESGWAFAVPTYIFIACFAVVLTIGLMHALRHGGHPAPIVAPAPIKQGEHGEESLAGLALLWLLMRSFASGCTAMTGVEAVSNGITIFHEPAITNARRTLTLIVIILAALLGGVAYLAHAYEIGAMDQTRPDYQSVMSQLVAAVMGRGVFYYVAIASLLCVLALSANTSFVGFPRLCRLIATDRYLPIAFAVAGRRLVFSVGILFLAATVTVLLITFRGITDRLIPLFAVGAFAAFTASQAGMVVHWYKVIRREGEKTLHNRLRLGINAIGAVTTACALIVILFAKFVQGAWIVLIALPMFFVLFRLMKRHYLRVGRAIRTHDPLTLDSPGPPVIVVPTEGWNRLTEKSIDLAVRLSPDVTAIHLTALNPDEPGDQTLRHQWEKDVEEPARRIGVTPPRLEIVHTPYRKFVEPLLECLERVKAAHPQRQIAVVVPEVVKRHWWQFVLHQSRAQRLRRALLKRGDRRMVLISVPWYLEDPIS